MDKPDLKVVQFTGTTRRAIEADEVLENMKGLCTYVLVVGWGTDEEGNPLIAASTSADLREAFFILDQYKFAMLTNRWEIDDE